MLVGATPALRLLERRNNQRKEDERDQLTYGSCLPFLTHAEAEDLDELASNHAIFLGELSRGHILYTPGAMIAGESVEELDHVGLKLSLMVVGPNEGDKTGVATLRSMQMEAKESGKKSDALDEVLACVDNKISEMKSQAQPPSQPSSPQQPQPQPRSPADAQAAQVESPGEKKEH